MRNTQTALKSRADVERIVAVHLERHQLEEVAREAFGEPGGQPARGAHGEPSARPTGEASCEPGARPSPNGQGTTRVYASIAWPERIPLGRPTKAELAAHAAEIGQTATELAKWARTSPLHLEYATRKSGGTLHDLPTHAVVNTIDDAAALCGQAAVRDLARDRKRAASLHEVIACSDGEALAGCDAEALPRDDGEALPRDASNVLASALKATRAWSDVDFDLLVQAVRWFAEHDASGLTPRQVPLAGFSAKWLDAVGRRAIIEKLCGKKLGLAERSRSVELAYLDPSYLKRGMRRFDSWVTGDAFTLPYPPTCCFIVENKDTFRAFPPVEGGVCLFGSGWAGAATLPELPWLSSIERIFYWGDIDADGFEILDAYRAAGVNAKSLLMDMQTYRAFEPFGTSMSAGKTQLAARAEKALPHLTDDERELYRLLVSPDCKGHRRIEQERIPFSALFESGAVWQNATKETGA